MSKLQKLLINLDIRDKFIIKIIILKNMKFINNC